MGNRTTNRVWGGALTVALSTMQPVSAHHSAAPHFDLAKTLTLKATVTKFAFVNPHAYVYFDAPGVQGKPELWRCELPARALLERQGWTALTFAAGQKITVEGAPARREARVCYMTAYVKADGQRVDLGRKEPGLPPLTGAAANPVPVVPASYQLIAGHPNFSGYWRLSGPPKPGPGPGGQPAQPGVPSEAGIRAAKGYDDRFDNPAIKCQSANIIFGWIHDQNVNEIKQDENVVVLRYGYMDFERKIYLNSEHPKRLKPSPSGHSVGHWQGETLVVDTVGFTPAVWQPLKGVMLSGQAHIVEYFTLDPSRSRLTRSYKVEDPLYLQQAATGSDVMDRSAQPYERYHCQELSGSNNKRPKK